MNLRMSMFGTNPGEKNHELFVYLLFFIGAGLLVFNIYILRTTLAGADNLQTSVYITICGDGLLSAGEVCDLGAGFNVGTYGSSTAARICAPGCATFGPYCGDDVLQVRFGEVCDDGNHTNGDLCNSVCQVEVAVPPGTTGSPTVGPIPQNPAAAPGSIPALTETKVVIRGKAYPSANVTILLDGKEVGRTRADSNADFMYSATDITPGTASFGFISADVNGVPSITTSAIFDVLQGAITTVSNVFIPPTIAVNKSLVPVGELLTISGQSIPFATIKADIFSKTRTNLTAEADATGLWVLQVDTKSLTEGANTAKSFFEISSTVKSGYGRSVSFNVGDGPVIGRPSPDLNKDGKVNLIDFSIFLISWNTKDPKTDFNIDGATNLADFSIMLFEWTG
jgi:cysteine-rich repeat protein